VKFYSSLFKKRLSTPFFGKQRFFLLFVVWSLLFWGITKLSKTYQISLFFEIELEGVPNTLRIDQKKEPIEINLSATGFDILRYQWFRNTLQLRSPAEQVSDPYFTINLIDQQFYLQEQMYGNTVINGFKQPFLRVNYYSLSQKRVPILVNASIDFRPGYLLDFPLKTTPDSITVIGSKEQLDTLEFVVTEPFEKQELSENFKTTLNLVRYEEMEFDYLKVIVNGSVSSYSEKQFELPVEVNNLSSNTQIKLFPSTVKLTVLARLEQLQQLKNSDFELSVNFALKKDTISSLPVILSKAPKGIKKINWNPKQIEFLIRK
tara:strand:+ start:12179 stop:13135 length:957 start_codon:yes stop_codon:yes gene_type:complete